MARNRILITYVLDDLIEFTDMANYFESSSKTGSTGVWSYKHWSDISSTITYLHLQIVITDHDKYTSPHGFQVLSLKQLHDYSVVWMPSVLFLDITMQLNDILLIMATRDPVSKHHGQKGRDSWSECDYVKYKKHIWEVTREVCTGPKWHFGSEALKVVNMQKKDTELL